VVRGVIIKRQEALGGKGESAFFSSQKNGLTRVTADESQEKKPDRSFFKNGPSTRTQGVGSRKLEGNNGFPASESCKSIRETVGPVSAESSLLGPASLETQGIIK